MSCESSNTFKKRPPSTAMCGVIQVFFIVSYAQFFQNTFISTRKLLNATRDPVFFGCVIRLF